MPRTTQSDVFVPEVATQVASAQFPNELALSMAGAGFVEGFPPVDAMGEEGDTVKFPRWNALGEMTALSEGTAMTPEAMGHTVDTASVQVGGKAVEITDWANLAGRGDPSEEVGKQVARLAARYIDARLVVEAETSTLTETPGAAISWDVIVDALVTHWGDAAFADNAGLVIHSVQMGTILKDPDFQSLADFGESPRRDGMIGRIAGMPVFVSDRLTVTAGTPNTYNALILKRGALGLKFQRELLVETDRDILVKSDVIAADVRFAVHLMYANPLPVIVLTTQ